MRRKRAHAAVACRVGALTPLRVQPDARPAAGGGALPSLVPAHHPRHGGPGPSDRRPCPRSRKRGSGYREHDVMPFSVPEIRRLIGTSSDVPARPEPAAAIAIATATANAEATHPRCGCSMRRKVAGPLVRLYSWARAHDPAEVTYLRRRCHSPSTRWRGSRAGADRRPGERTRGNGPRVGHGPAKHPGPVRCTCYAPGGRGGGGLPERPKGTVLKTVVA